MKTMSILLTVKRKKSFSGAIIFLLYSVNVSTSQPLNFKAVLNKLFPILPDKYISHAVHAEWGNRSGKRHTVRINGANINTQNADAECNAVNHR